ncbi:asparagine synthase domain-containing protein [Ditylenchus destructor]|uniref:Asparagine synthetase [glutamine-hydrolyzing] n=1 Tax=Ditylenchus destructor TaxID=166010 RepID=A0AAD4MV81_9BILA|nr:asparagine synthase domain-containing protein [Ditylenchus destructor]
MVTADILPFVYGSGNEGLRRKRQKHRGPDYKGSYQHPTNGNILCHERLAIKDLKCTQPIQGTQSDHQVIHNGEIYNYAKLEQGLLSEFTFTTVCDSEAIIFLYEKYRGDNNKICNMLDGVFAFALIYGDEFLAARDPIGIKPLYYGVDKDGLYFFSSEMKCIEDVCGETKLHAFPPGHYFTPEEGFVRYYKPNWHDYELAVKEQNLDVLRQLLIDATHKRLMSDAPIGVLLSGGLDSSLISAIAARRVHQHGKQIKSFSIGLDASAPDLVAARKVAKFLGTDHHEFYFTAEEGIAVIKKLIWHLESYDVTSVRASTPMYFLSKYISELGVKVVLSGEGADEIFGGYLYFHSAPNDEEFQKETIRRVNLLSTADCLRADKSCMAHGLEVRVPFLDKTFLDAAMTTHPKHRRPKLQDGASVEKWILRKAFDDKENPYIPPEVLWRQKEQFSDGVGYGWIDSLVKSMSDRVTDEELASAESRFPVNPPNTKEAYFIRKTFEEHYPSQTAAETVVRWIPKWQANTDPSGRASNVHNSAKNSDVSNGDTHNGRCSNGISKENGTIKN